MKAVHGRTALVALLALAIAPVGATAKTSTKHHLKTYKVERHVTLDENEKFYDQKVKCDNGDIATDGMWRVDHVSSNPQLDDDGPYNKYNGVYVVKNQATPGTFDEYTFSLHNHSEDDAQVKLWVVCLDDKTVDIGHDHPLVQDASTQQKTHSLGVGEHEVGTDADCPSGFVPIAPGYEAVNNVGHVKQFRSWPKSGAYASGSGWTWGFYVEASASTPPPNDIRVSYRCLELKTALGGPSAHKHKLTAKFKSFNPSLEKGKTTNYKIDCDDHYKGLVGAWDVRFGHGSWTWEHDKHHLWFLGMDPQPKSRVFKVQNADPANDHAGYFGLACFGERTGKPVSS